MKKILTFLFLGSVMLCMVSCGGSKTEDAGVNESIQGTFFGASFGASKDEVIKAFAAHDLILDKRISSDDVLQFGSKRSQYFSFGGLVWERICVYITNGRFYCIELYNPFKDKTEAIKGSERILKKISKKYNLEKKEQSDTTIYMIALGTSKKDPQRFICVSSYRYESVEKEICYSASLAYGDRSFDNYVSDEL